MTTRGARRSAPRAAPADQTVVRRHNLGLVLRVLQQGHLSRAGIALETGLNKATVSSLVTELAERGLVRDLGLDQDRRLGRPATLVELDGRHVATIGLQLNVDYIAVLVTDFAARVLFEQRRPLDAVHWPRQRVIRALAALADEGVGEAGRSGARVAGLTLAVPGVVDVGSGRLCVAPNLGWRDVLLADRLAAAMRNEVPVALGNDANLGAVAEYRMGEYASTPDLAYIVGEYGVGGGVIVQGQPLHGAAGFSAEVGHLQLQRDGAPCNCGSRGCWETVVGLRPLLRGTVPDLAPALEADDTLNPEAKVAFVVARAEQGDPCAVKALEELGEWLGIGLATLVNLLNPSVVVLAGFFSLLAPWLLPTAVPSLERHTIAPRAGGCRVVTSQLGFSAATLGGAIHAAERVYADPTLVPALSA